MPALLAAWLALPSILPHHEVGRYKDQGRSGMLRLEGLTKLYGDGASPGSSVHGLCGVNLAVPEGEFVSIVGRSGCGKSTLLKLVAGLLAPDSGSVLLDELAVVPRSNDVALVFQEATLLPWRSVLGNVELGLEAEGMEPKERRTRALEAIRMVGLEEAAQLPPYQLSGGMQQRVGVARALAVRPRVLLMDEPFAAVDDFTRQALRNQLLDLWNELRMTVLFVTHDIDEAIFLGNRICALDSAPGRVLDVLDVPFSFPRDDTRIRESHAGIELRTRIVTLLRGNCEGGPVGEEVGVR